MEEWNTIKLKRQNCFEKCIHTQLQQQQEQQLHAIISAVH